MSTSIPAVGETAPDFTAEAHTGETLTLSDYKGHTVALYFYPKDDTPGCTKQACSLRDGFAALQDAGIQVIGVSADDLDSHTAFAEKHDLPFPLIADPDHELLEQYGVWAQRSMFGNLFMGIKRTTFLIDADGVIQHVFKRPKTGAHASEILKKVDAVA
jgi:thioredoxin-dependent peroxiredoxin